jgi:hypothetical protein
MSIVFAYIAASKSIIYWIIPPIFLVLTFSKIAVTAPALRPVPAMKHGIVRKTATQHAEMVFAQFLQTDPVTPQKQLGIVLPIAIQFAAMVCASHLFQQPTESKTRPTAPKIAILPAATTFVQDLCPTLIALKDLRTALKIALPSVETVCAKDWRLV